MLVITLYCQQTQVFPTALKIVTVTNLTNCHFQPDEILTYNLSFQVSNVSFVYTQILNIVNNISTITIEPRSSEEQKAFDMFLTTYAQFISNVTNFHRYDVVIIKWNEDLIVIDQKINYKILFYSIICLFLTFAMIATILIIKKVKSDRQELQSQIEQDTLQFKKKLIPTASFYYVK
ncbi:hypothetical protein SS50377_22863 [Spironucleus salmonicida]|uniref:Transmembrane protein n=1 Tax=Spironucleus salmonicida TaxID=348837 RepID=V6M5U7_9EUKA|nr:hypothetical protein SS50377_22863 [Spironucleus salmonicida]|eukprot:EST48714.1 Hypothetical protein SS50377_11029 [Spironucleus salmonicida]